MRRRLSVMPSSRAISQTCAWRNSGTSARRRSTSSITSRRHSISAKVRSSGSVASILRPILSVAPQGNSTCPSFTVRKHQPPVAHALDVADAAHAEPQPGQDLLALVRTAGGREQIAVAAGVDDDAGTDRETALLALEGDGGDAPSIDDRLARPGVKEQPHPRARHHLVEGETKLLGIVGDRVAHPVRTRAPHQAPA